MTTTDITSFLQTSDSTMAYVENSTSSAEYESEYETELNPTLAIVGYVPVIVVTIIGNLLVIIAYCRRKEVRANPTNTLIFSLSVSDFLIGTLVLTVNLHWVYYGNWVFGETICRLWSVLDYTATFMSTINIIFISLDRFLLMTQKTRYRVIWTRKRVVIITLSGWTCSAIIYTVLTFAMGDLDLVDFGNECELEVVYLVGFTIGVQILEFGIPFPVILCLNAFVYFQIQKRSRNLRRFKRDLGLPSMDTRRKEQENPSVDPGNESREDNTDGSCPSNVSNIAVISGRISDTNQHSQSSRTVMDTFGTSTRHLSAGIHHPNVVDDAPSLGTRRRLDAVTYHQHKRQFARHKKAAVTLSILVGSFLICWLPYEIVSILQAKCGEDECFSETTWEVVNGLLWSNSALNPILYGLTNPLLRRHMLGIFRCPGLFRHAVVAPMSGR